MVGNAKDSGNINWEHLRLRAILSSRLRNRMFSLVFLCTYSSIVHLPYTLLTPLLAFMVYMYSVSLVLGLGICLCFAIFLKLFPSCSDFAICTFFFMFHFDRFLLSVWKTLYSNSTISFLCRILCVPCTCSLFSGIEPLLQFPRLFFYCSFLLSALFTLPARLCELLHLVNDGQSDIDLPPLKEEVQKTIRELKTGKAVGNDNIPSEMFKSIEDSVDNMLSQLTV